MFQLSEYYDVMREGMNTGGWTPANTVKRFITNLAALRPVYAGWDYVPFNILGQQWNRLGYQERNKQQDEAIKALSGPAMRRRGRRGDDT